MSEHFRHDLCFFVGFALLESTNSSIGLANDFLQRHLRFLAEFQNKIPLDQALSLGEGTGHHSVIKHNGEYYAVYHGRDVGVYDKNALYVEERTARICKLYVKDGIITAEQY